MKKIILTIGQLNTGGAERRLLQLVRSALAMRLALKVTLYVVSGKPGTLDDDFKNAGAFIVYGKPGIGGLVDLWSLCRILRPDVLHINAETAAGFYALAGFLAGVPSRFAHYRSMQDDSGVAASIKSGFYQVLTNLFCQKIIGVSDGSREGRIIIRPWQTIYNGITPPTDNYLAETDSPSQFNTKHTRITVFGRLIKSKNVDRSLAVFAAFKKRNPRSELHIVGPYISVSKDQIENFIDGACLSGSVHLHGEVDSPFQYLSQSSALLLTSRIEGLPGAVIEALACGTPVISTDLPGSLEIAARVKGIVCLSLSDDDETWAKALEKAVNHPRPEIRDSFCKSPFNTELYVRDIMKVWNVDT